MTRPEDALGHARESAARKRAEGLYPEPGPAPLDGDMRGDRPRVPEGVLAEWAVVRGDPELVYSTRRLGAPMTGFKRLLLRLLRQYTADVEARQTRFNVALLAHLDELERRVAALERRDAE
jgi:hypothetical protein